MTRSPANAKLIVIEAGRPRPGLLREAWEYRELLALLAWRDILVRYKQTVIGVAWSVIRPLLLMVVFTVVFGKLARMPSDDVPYPILVFAALLPWQLFATAFTEASNSLINNASMLSKVYFPRLILPVSAVIVSLMDFLIASAIFGFLMAWYQFVPPWRIVFLPFFLILTLMGALGLGMWMGALNVKYRDFRYIVPFIVQVGLYASPVGFSTNVIPEEWKLIYSLNPMVGVIDGFRWAVLGRDSQLYVHGFVVSAAMVFAIFCFGIVYFRKTERSFADVI